MTAAYIALANSLREANIPANISHYCKIPHSTQGSEILSSHFTNEVPMQQFILKIRSKISQLSKAKMGIIAGVLLVLVGLMAMLFANMTETKQQDQIADKPTFTNYLKPASEIKVGEFRYVSTCQLLKIEDIKSLFGINDDTYITEDYYDANAAPIERFDRNIETNCRYDLGDTEVSLDAEQSFEELDTTDPQQILYSLGDELMAEKIKLFEKAVSDTTDTDLKEFVSTLKNSVDTFNQETLSEELDTSNFVVPVGRGLFSFNFIHDNVIYKLEYKIKTSSKDEFALSSQDIKDNLKKSRAALEMIMARANDGSLDQSPAPTILGDTEYVGTTKVIEPCALLTSQLYQTVMGSVANKEISRATVYNNIVKDRVAAGDGQPLSPSSSCERSGRINDTSSVIRLSMRHTKSADTLQAALNKGYKFDGNDKLLQTSADWSGYFNIDKPGQEICAFRVGPYSFVVDILNTTSAGLFDSVRQAGGTEQQCVQLINSIADSARQYSK